MFMDELNPYISIKYGIMGNDFLWFVSASLDSKVKLFRTYQRQQKIPILTPI